MADLVCNQRCTPGVWVDLATTKAAGPTGQPAEGSPIGQSSSRGHRRLAWHPQQQDEA